MTFRKPGEKRPPPDQSAARARYGNAMVDYWIAHPTQNMACWGCGEHHGLVCTCSRDEKARAFARTVLEREERVLKLREEKRKR